MELDEFIHICMSVLPNTKFISSELLCRAYVNPPGIAREPVAYADYGKSSHIVYGHCGYMLVSQDMTFGSIDEFKKFLVDHTDEILTESQHYSDYRDVDEVVAKALRNAGLLFDEHILEKK